MFEIKFAKSFIKDLRKISKEVQDDVLDKWIPRIQNDPDVGKRFSGKNLNKFSRFAFRYKRNDYRIVYQVRKKEVLIVFLAIGSRENFYKKIKRKR